MVYHHALACISSPKVYLISRRLYFVFAMMICNSLWNWWYTRLWRDLLSCIFVLRAQLSSSDRDCFFISQELKRARTFIDTSLTLSVCCANRLLICYSLVGHNEWRNVSGCRWFSPVTVVCRKPSPTQVCGLSYSHFRWHRLRKQYYYFLCTNPAGGARKKHLQKASAFFNEINPLRDLWNALRAWNMASPCEIRLRACGGFISFHIATKE